MLSNNQNSETLKEESLLVGVTLKGDEVRRFNEFKDSRRVRTNAAAAYALMLDSLDRFQSQQAAETETATA